MDWFSNARLDSDQILRRSIDHFTEPDLTESILALCEVLDLPNFTTMQSSRPEHRQVCVYICGLSQQFKDVEDCVLDLVDGGKFTEAALLALIHDRVNLSLRALKGQQKSTLHRELSLALVGYMSGNLDDIWLETIEEIAEQLEDPYARAILAFVARGDWHDVLKEISLPLKYRVGVALLYLADDELTSYIQRVTSQVVEEGDIEGVVMTGLTELSVGLFENYIRRTFDLQTAVLALSFSSPKYFEDIRVNVWLETYRSQLDNWRMFVERTIFDISSTKLSVAANGKSTISRPRAQVSIACAFCNQHLDRNPVNDTRSSSATGAADFGIHHDRIFGDEKSGTCCPKCGRHMPRCTVCRKWIGTPDPHTRGGLAQKMTFQEAFYWFTAVCRGCWHVSHQGHAEEWFRRQTVCAVPGCDCRCMEIDATNTG